MSIIKYLAENQNFFFFLTIVLGLIAGSFLNVVIYRLPKMMQQSYYEECCDFLGEDKAATKEKQIFSLSFPASHCYKCKNRLLWWHNIPLLSFILLRGKCFFCKNKISWQYPLVELLTGLTSFYVAYKFGFTAQTFALLFLTWGLVALTFIDFNTKLLPDGIVLFLLWLGLFLNLFNLFTGITSAVLGAILGYMSLWIIAQLFKLVRKIDGMGHGDFKLFAVFGAWFGWQMLPFIILLASLLALFVGMFLIFSKKLKFDKPISFGPYIALSGWFFIFYGVDIINEVNKFLIFA